MFDSEKSDNFIELSKDDENIVWMEKYYIDRSTDQHIKEFCQLMIDAFKSMKMQNCYIHRQFITMNDLYLLENDDRWEFIDQANDTFLIECDIDDAPNCIIEAFLHDIA